MVDIIFYIFASLSVLFALGVIAFRNQVYCVLSLIATFFSSAALILMLCAEYIAFTIVIVYVGAIAVLFLFVVMMLNVEEVKTRKLFSKHVSATILVASILAWQIISATVQSMDSLPAADSLPYRNGSAAYGQGYEYTNNDVDNVEFTNTYSIGMLLYTDYFIAFQASGLILIVGMIGAIVLTIHHKPGVRKQSVTDQVSASRDSSLLLTSPEVKKGVEL